MAGRKDLVNLDAMIVREDFASQGNADQAYDMVQSISLRDFTPGALVGPNLRKPDFQRETNHWTPAQVLSLLERQLWGRNVPSVRSLDEPVDLNFASCIGPFQAELLSY